MATAMKSRFTAGYPAVQHFDSNGCCVRSIRYKGNRRQSTHRHDATSITLITRGQVQEESDFGIVRAGIAHVVVKPSGVVHADTYGAMGLDTLQVRVPPDALAADPAALQYAWFDGGPVLRAMMSLLRHCKRANGEDVSQSQAYISYVLQVVAKTPPPDNPESRPPWLNDIADLLDARFASRISTADLARSAGIHRVSLARAFRRHFQCSITDYVRRKRVTAACRELETQSGSLADIAAQVGFADQSHLTRAFQTEIGISPNRLRQLIR